MKEYCLEERGRERGNSLESIKYNSMTDWDGQGVKSHDPGIKTSGKLCDKLKKASWANI